jgi:uncharacterized membrane protein YeaQ/YmgE (transglycosylase-associated protein family)
MFSFAVWVFTGVTAGAMAWGIRPPHDQRPAYILLAMGVAGAILGGAIAAAIWPTWVNSPEPGHDIFAGWAMSAVGAVALLAVYLNASGSRESRHRA